jgi:hypothetical protein
MAKSFSSSSLDMEKFATAMSSVAPVAKSAGLSVEQTTALLGTLTDRGLDASTAGTGLRNIFLELAKEGMTFEEAMNQINTASDKNAASLELFGKRGATVGTILSETAEDVSILEGKLNDAGGAAKEMADKQLNTLNGALDLLKSAWEGFILDLEQGTGVFAGLKDVIFFVAKNLKTIIKLVAVAGATFLSYKASILAANIASKAFAVVQGLVALATGKGTSAMKLFNTVIKANPIGLLITALGAAVTAFSLFSDGAENGALSQERFNAAVEKGNKLAEEQNEIVNKNLQEQESKIEQNLRKTLLRQKREGKSAREKIQSVERAAKAIQIANNKEIRAIDKKAAKLQSEFVIGTKDLKQKERNIEITGELEKLEENRAKLEVNVENARKRAFDIYRETQKARNKFEKTNEKNDKKTIKNISKQLTGLEKLKKELSDIRKLRSDELVINGETVLFQAYTDQTKELTTQIELLEARLKLSEEGFKAQKKEVVTDVSEITGEEDLREEANKAVDDFVNIQVEGAEEVANNDKKYYQERLTALKQFAQKAIEIANAKTDKEIENTNKEIEASKTRQSELQTLAAQGNLTAEQSVSAEIKRELELERQKEALEKKKARRQIIIEGLDLLSSKIDGGEKDAVTSTLNDMTRLLGALAALPGFIDGTETTVGEALGKPQLNTGQDDYIIRVDGKEKILNPSMSARTGNMTTEEITRAAEMYSSGMFDQNVLIHPQVAALNQPFQNSNEILKKFDSLESTIRNKPILSDLKFDDLQKALVVTVEQNGDLKRAHYKLK